MITFETVSEWVELCLRRAKQLPNSAETFEAQAYAVCQFASDQLWQTNPELDKRIRNAWTRWQEKFWDIKFST